jgi:hypothetical protein
MTTLYKLTDKNGQTRGGTQWAAGVSHSATGDKDQPLCSDGWIHAYEHPLLATLLNPIHANFSSPRLWEAEGEIGARDGQLKCGCRKLTTTREIPLPEVTTEQRIKFAILYAREVCKSKEFLDWSDKWLSGEDRTEKSAAEAARAAAEAEAWAAARAAWAAEAWAAEAWAAEAEAWAAEAAARAAAEAEAWAAEAEATNSNISLIELAEKACQ